MLFHISPTSLLLAVGVAAFLLGAVAGPLTRRRRQAGRARAQTNAAILNLKDLRAFEISDSVISVQVPSYRRKAVLLPWERKALSTFSNQLRPGLHLCPQVRLADMLSIDAADRSIHRSALNQVACKSVDFCVVDAVTGGPVLVIELDDKSHGRADRQARDVLVNSVLREAGIPIARFNPSQRLDIRPHLDAALAAVSVGMKIAAE